MAKAVKKAKALTFVDIVMGAEAEVIKAAYEARLKVDELLAEREAAYRRIAELEAEVETVIGEEGVFAFPDPPVPVASGVRTPAPKPKPGPARKPAPAQPAAKSDGPAGDAAASETAAG